VYYSSQVFLLGAEFTRVYSHDFVGDRPAPEPGAKPVDTTKPEVKAAPPRPGAAAPAAAERTPARRRQA